MHHDRSDGKRAEHFSVVDRAGGSEPGKRHCRARMVARKVWINEPMFGDPEARVSSRALTSLLDFVV